MMELGEKIVEGSTAITGEKKPLKAFYPLKDMAAGTVIKGKFQGKFQSKNNPESFFFVFQDRDGEGYGYGFSQALEDKIKIIQEHEEKLGTKELYSEIIFNGRIKNKAGNRTYYSFSTPTIYKLASPPIAGLAAPVQAAVTTEEIPF